MKKLILFLLLLLPFALKAQQPAVPAIQVITLDSFTQKHKDVRLYDSWKFHSGDDISWASPLYNDSSWKHTATLFEEDSSKQFIKAGFKGIGWFRKEIYIDSNMLGKLMAFTLSNDGAIAIYMDGKLLHQFGKFQTAQKHLYIDPQEYPIVFSIDKAGPHLLAVKYENYEVVDNSNWFSSDGDFGFHVRLKVGEDAIESYRSKTLITSIFIFGSACLFATLAFIHFMLFFFYKRGTSNFYFGLFNCSIALLAFSIYVGLTAGKMQYIAFAMYATIWAVILAAYSLSAFVNNLFQKKKWSHYLVILCCVIVAVLFILSNNITPLAAYILVIFSSSEAIVLIILAMIKKIPGSKILGAGILCFFLFLFVVILISSILVPELQWKSLTGFLIVLLAVSAVFSIPVSISFYLAWSFSSINKNLSRQLEQVEQLSQKSLRQEQEKQQLLEGRKEELEKEVAFRTIEVMRQKEQIELQHDALKTEKKKSDDLLLNILPAEVANELKEKGEAEAKLFDHVTVLFTDFVNFTQMSELMNPQQLVAQLHENFKAFDEIMERNGLEKIKTIGDAYLAVSGMPVANERHAYNAVKAGLEIAAYIRNQQYENRFEVRVGIHSGPLVAGIVGVKKFAYDIWGDTVNTASRMESSSEAGKINISESTYKLVKDDFTFMHRGKIDAKHKGAIDMYFVEG
ncbi:hypothetical protein F0919_09415 [Taibaiella lutea]|uniref:Guanylate cyclase domain-containing protein n=1 Tax=Taibaiella lutea TaxID=2608001 RepID=A0A5M6CIH1_9BACT|nr:adenylate/guanylate cyclase domain-containing protein [Taibaiella lutea]KAA5534816.1 hypothetical protein F0919_09415 [Taibaiella lutea]